MNSQNIFSITTDWAKSQNFSVEAFKEIESTNSFAKNNAPKNSFCLYLAENQTAGRGRGKNTWSSPQEGKALLSSWSFQTAKALPVVFPLRVGLAFYEACTETWGENVFALKAPNDLYMQKQKVAGLLIEAIQNSHVVIGLGFNIFTHPNIDRSGCLSDFVTVTNEKWNHFLNSLHKKLSKAVANSNAQLQKEERSSLLLALNQFELLSEKYTDVSPDGDLIRASGKTSWQDL